MQLELLHESMASAIAEVVRHAGGAKAVAATLWPTKPIGEAHRHLLDCLNVERPHRLSPDEVAALARIGRQVGCHAIIEFMCRDAGYAAPVTIEPETQAEDMLRAIREELQAINERTPRLVLAAERIAKRLARAA